MNDTPQCTGCLECVLDEEGLSANEACDEMRDMGTDLISLSTLYFRGHTVKGDVVNGLKALRERLDYLLNDL